MITVGWDWASSKHDLIILDADGKRLAHLSPAHTGQALAELAGQLAAFEPNPDHIQVAIEDHDGPAIDFILAQGYQLYVVNPKFAAKAREVITLSTAKDDKRDAAVLAELLRTQRHRIRRVWPRSERTVEMDRLTAWREKVSHQCTAIKQHLRALLMAWFPELNNACPNLASAWLLDLLDLAPLLEDLQNLPRAQLEDFCRRHRLPAARRQELWTWRQGVGVPISAGRQATLRQTIRDEAATLKHLLCRLADIEAQIKQATCAHPDFAIMDSLPLVEGFCTKGRLLAAFGEDRRLPLTWQEHAARTGLSPITVASGKMTMVRRRRACNHLDQKAFLTLANQSRSVCAWARDLYQKKRQAGKSHNSALRCVGRKWVRIVYCMWYRREVYDPTIPNNAA